MTSAATDCQPSWSEAQSQGGHGPWGWGLGEGIEWVGKGMESWEGSWEGVLGVTWMRCTMDGRAWLELGWSGAWELRIGAELQREETCPLAWALGGNQCQPTCRIGYWVSVPPPSAGHPAWS